MTYPEAARRRCLAWLDGTFDDVYLNGMRDVIVPNIGTTSVLVSFEELDTGQVLVEVRAPVLEDISLSPELSEYLAWNSATFQLGTLSLHRDRSGSWLQFGYALLAETTSRSLINQLVLTIGHTADELSRELQPRFGGSFIHPHSTSKGSSCSAGTGKAQHSEIR